VQRGIAREPGFESVTTVSPMAESVSGYAVKTPAKPAVREIPLIRMNTLRPPFNRRGFDRIESLGGDASDVTVSR
jgi:hypothetical protein